MQKSAPESLAASGTKRAHNLNFLIWTHLHQRQLRKEQGWDVFPHGLVSWHAWQQAGSCLSEAQAQVCSGLGTGGGSSSIFFRTLPRGWMGIVLRHLMTHSFSL